jgi:voltage-gated potassium channel Kch
MKRKKYRYLIAAVSFVLIYLLLLELLVICERGYPGAHIRTLGDAFWFSLVTLSTVGYGDVTPLSPMGHVIGVIFLILSMGLLVALIGSTVSFLASEGFPMLKLRFMRNRNWYYFADFTPESDTLAKDILIKDEDAVIIYGIRRDEEIEMPDYPCLFINVSPARITARKNGKGERCRLFFLKENEIGSNLKAVDIHALDADVYSATTSGQEKMSGNIHFFHTYDCCARSYWRAHPLKSNEDNIVIIGFGNYGQAVLERAILTNINDTDFDVTYHIFGDAERFLNIHDHLRLAFGINERKPGMDSLFFYKEDWTAAHDVIGRADRIIICEDEVQTGWDDMWQLRRYYNYRGRIDLRTNRTAPGVSYFGTNEQIYTVDQIIRTRLNDAAKAMNDLYRKSVEDSLDWDELSDQLKQSKIAVADHLYMKIRMLLNGKKVSSLDGENCQAAYDAYCAAKEDPAALDRLRRIEHARWVRFYAYYNWGYGDRRNDRRHENPMMRRYDMLTEGQKAYHDRAWELIGEMAKQLNG